MPGLSDQPTNARADGASSSIPPAAGTPTPAPLPAAGTPNPAPLPPENRRSLSRAAWVALVTGVVLLIFMLVFILQNNVPAEFTFLGWSSTVPLGVAVLFAAIAGALITAMVGTIRMFVLGRSVRHLRQERAARG